MARIRTIKPEFFTSEDIVALTPFARLLYVALWCEADKEGRLVWKPKTFKMRYLPADEVEISGLCEELTGAGLVVLYGDGYAHIPAFKAHQHINPRETPSQLPDPSDSTRQARVGTRQARVTTGQLPDSDVQGGREGKGREGNDLPASDDACVDNSPEPFKTPDEIFGDGVDYLVRHGVPDRGARSFLGRMRKELKDDLIAVELLTKAQQLEVSDPVAWLRKAARSRIADGRSGSTGVAL
jgi:hypothetical protein